ncbi:class I tRNA ligase family protein, partial [Patescibacteria group bacterium]|nr:class I tRNA ligase family protein [Patescibacteria group bacterium]
FWVARMILMTTYIIGEIPFEKVYFHGMITDEKGKKMSKSSGTGIDPVEVIDKYGADALRLSLLVGNPAGNDMCLREEKIVGQRNFVNKLWNIFRFVVGNINDGNYGNKVDPKDLSGLQMNLEDKWILSRLDRVIQRNSVSLDKYKLSLAIEELENFVWHDLADWYIEIVKSDLYGDDENRKMVAQKILIYILANVLILLHPFAPHVTEVLWENLSGGNWGKLIEANWAIGSGFANEKLDNKFEEIKSVVVANRVLLHDYGLENEKDNKLFMKLNRDDVDAEYLSEINKRLIKNVDIVEIVETLTSDMVSYSTPIADTGVIVTGDVRKREEQKVLEEIKKFSKYFIGLEKKLANKEYVANAPKEVIEKDKNKYIEAKATMDSLLERKEKLSGK